MWLVAQRNLKAVRLLGSGGNGDVFLVQDTADGEQYALKVIKCFSGQDFQRLSQEASLLSSLPCHPNIVRFRGARSIVQKEHDRKYRLLMILTDYVDGGTLVDRLQSEKPNKHLFESVANDIGRAIEYLHSREPPLIHQDVKMENILYDTKEDTWKLCDFGSARKELTLRTQPMSPWELAHSAHVLAEITTKAYRPPECVDVYAFQGVTTKADVWMFGCVLFALCTNRLPFGDASVLSILNAELQLRRDDVQFQWQRDFLPLVFWCLQSSLKSRASVSDCLQFLSTKKEEVIPENVRQQYLKAQARATQEMTTQAMTTQAMATQA